MDKWGYMLLVIGFIALFGLIESLLLMIGNRRSNADRISKRLYVISQESAASEIDWVINQKFSSHPQIDQFLKQFKLFDRLNELIRQTGKKYTVEKVLYTMGCLALAGVVLGFLLNFTLLTGMVLVAVLGFLPVMFLSFLKKKRLNKIDEQMPSILDLLAQSMRAGHSFTGALRSVGNEGAEPVAREFRLASDEIGFGSTVRVGITNMAERIGTMDMRLFALAVMIQHETGGNLSKLLQDLAILIRERQKLKKTIRVMSAEGRASAWILGGLPVAMGVLLYFFNRDYISYFWTTPGGINLLKWMAVAMVFSILWIRKIIDIKA
jgi:tight adherence protein B